MDAIRSDEDVVGRLEQRLEELFRMQNRGPLSWQGEAELKRIRQKLARAAAGQIIR